MLDITLPLCHTLSMSKANESNNGGNMLGIDDEQMRELEEDARIEDGFLSAKKHRTIYPCGYCPESLVTIEDQCIDSVIVQCVCCGKRTVIDPVMLKRS